MSKSMRYAPEARERAVRLVHDAQKDHQSQWAAILSVADKIGCTQEALRQRVRREERDSGLRASVSSDESDRLKQLERENRELKRANKILRKPPDFLSQAELDRK
jgi:transposase